MKRRACLKLAAAASASLALKRIIAAPKLLSDRAISVGDYGADASGKQDSTTAIRNAVQAVKTKQARQLIFPRGTYRLSSVHEVAMNLSRISNLDVDGGGSTLLMSQDARCIDLSQCTDVAVRDFTIDYDPLPFTQGRVSASGPDWFTLTVDPGFPVPAQVDLLAFGQYNRAIRNFAQSGLNIYGAVLSVHAEGPTDLKIQLKQRIPVPVGAVLVLRFKQGHEACSIKDSRNIALRSINLRSSYFFGFSIARCSDLAFEEVTISMPADSKRLISTNADGMHITSCTGSLAIRKCIFHGMGDDAINVTTAMLRVKKNPSGKQSILVTKSNGAVSSSDEAQARVGDSLEILDPNDLHVVAHAKAIAGPGNVLDAQTDAGEKTPELDGFFVADPSLIPATEIVDCHFKGNRARAIVAHRNIQVRNCTFQYTTLSAILIAPDSIWNEGPPTRNVTIEGNRFSNCHYGVKSAEGSITIDVMHDIAHRSAPVPNGEAKNVSISNNTFDVCGTAAITCRSADQLHIERNRIGATWTRGDVSVPPRAMILSQLTNSAVTGNMSTSPNAIDIQDSPGITVSDNTGFSMSK